MVSGTPETIVRKDLDYRISQIRSGPPNVQERLPIWGKLQTLGYRSVLSAYYEHSYIRALSDLANVKTSPHASASVN